MSLIEWDDKTLSVGVDMIDDQHKILIGYINELSECINKSSEDIKLVFIKLVDYTKYHFKAEEAYFDRLNSDDIHLHKLQHKHFIEQLNTFISPSSSMVTLDLLDFLLDWIVIHIQCEDRKYIQKNHVSSSSLCT